MGGRVKDFIRTNYEFHFMIYRKAASSLLVEIISNIWLRMNPQFHLLHRHGHYRVSNRLHQALADALRARDPDRAVAALREDINSSYTVIVSSLGGGEPNALANRVGL